MSALPDPHGVVGKRTFLHRTVVSGAVMPQKVEAYYGADPAVHADASAVAHVSAQSVPTMIGLGEYENPLLDVHCAELFHRLAAAKRRAPRLVWLAGHNHTSVIAHFNTAEERLGREILDFIRLGR